MSDGVSIDVLGQAMGDFSNHEKLGFDLGAYVGDLAFEEDSGSEDISLEGLQQELEESESDEESSSNPERSITVAEVEPLMRDFGGRWKTAIELMHKYIMTFFSNFVCGMDIWKAALTQLLLYYARLTDCIDKIDGGAALNKYIVSFRSITLEIEMKKYLKTF